MITLEQPENILVISPHCDDAVFSCGQLLASYPGAGVVTVFAGRPPTGTALTEWDQASGFRPGDDVMGVRREEDRAALALLGACPIWLDFCDSQYQHSPSLRELQEALTLVIVSRQPQEVFFPLGLFHSDHQFVHKAALGLLRKYPQLSWFAYEDALYRRIPGLVQEQLQRCETAGVRPRVVTIPAMADPKRKREAVFCYRSQLRALTTPGRPGYADAFAPERFWHFVPLSPGSVKQSIVA
jgi:LmbE family N-acetylglucosaminyl deacetylase